MQRSSVTSLIQNLSWTDLKTRRKSLVFRPLCMFKIVNGLVKFPINDCSIPADIIMHGATILWQQWAQLELTPHWDKIIFGIELASELAVHNPVNQLPIEKTREAPCSFLFARPHLTVYWCTINL